MARQRSDTAPSVTVEPFDRRGTFIGVRSDIDVLDAELLRDAVASAIEAGYRQLVIDFGDATFGVGSADEAADA